jgi:glycosyl transferase family 87
MRMLKKSAWLVMAAALALAGMWTYTRRVLIPCQVADAAATERPRGNLSDLYPRWLGARELLLHGRDPYSAAVTREIQAGYYGRPLDASRPGDPIDQQGFAYPVYVVFGLAPTVKLPFEFVQKGFLGVLLVLTCASIPLWLRVIRWPAPPWTQVSMLALTLGSLTVIQGLKLQQMSLLVAALVAVAVALLIAGHAISAGILLALATIKPQLVWLLLLWLGIWTSADWKRRYRWAASFLTSMALLSVASEWLLPHWIPRFWQAVREYQKYTGAGSVLDALVPPHWGGFLELLALAASAGVCWRERRQPANREAFARTLSLMLAVTVLIAPTYAPYNQVLLIPAVLMLARAWQAIWQGSLAGRVLLVIAAGLIGWPFIAGSVLGALSFLLPPGVIQKACAVPFWTALPLPLGVATLMLILCYRRSFAASGERVPA